MKLQGRPVAPKTFTHQSKLFLAQSIGFRGVDSIEAMPDHESRLELSRQVLDGLSVGDALSEALSYQCYRARELTDFEIYRDGTVRYTDDTEMAIAIVETLSKFGTIDEDALAWAFASHYRKDPQRGYGRMAHKILNEIGAGVHWHVVSSTAFGRGSFGNGAAMRVAPLGAYFSDDLASVPGVAVRSARVTHYHPEGIAGAIAVAACSAAATTSRGRSEREAVEFVWETAIDLTPESMVKDGICAAFEMRDATPEEAARQLGNGAQISAQDTVPFCVWNACRCLDDYQEAIISTIEAGGDCDTNAAIVGGIVTGYAGRAAIPNEWLRVREPLGIASPGPRH